MGAGRRLRGALLCCALVAACGPLAAAGADGVGTAGAGIFGFGETGIRLPYDATAIGSTACGYCHVDLAEWQKTSHMALTGSFVTPETRHLWFSADMLSRPADTPGTAMGQRPFFRVAETGVFLLPARGDTPAARVAAVFGSGAHGFTPVALDGPEPVLRELSLSFLSDTGRWRPTPGQHGDPASVGVTLSREEGDRCLDCHATSLAWRDDRIDPGASAAGVQCERCHGPGSLHVQAVVMSAPDPYIFNPAKLPADRQVAFCGQCHRTAIDIDPQQALSDAPASARHAGAALMLSACYRASPPASTISCVDCHDPHRNNGAGPDPFTAACLRCHTDPGAAHRDDGVGRTSDCVECHMPKVPGLAGITFTNHWIRTPGREPVSAEGRGQFLAHMDSAYRAGLQADGLGRLARADLWKRAAQSAGLLGRPAEALRDYQRALETGPRYAARVEIAADFVRLGRRDEALRILEEAAAMAPARTQAYARQVGLHLDRGELEAANRVIQEWSARIPGDPLLGSMLITQGQLELARAHYRHALEIDPESAFAHLQLGNVARSSGELPAAIEHYRRAAALAPASLDAHLELGRALAATGSREEAVRELTRALAIDSTAAAAHMDLGLLLAMRGDHDEATHHLHRALDLDSTLAKAHWGLGRVSEAQDRLAEAVAQYRAALALQATPEVTGRLAWILAAAPDTSLRDGPEAVRLARQLTAQTRNQDPVALSILAAAFSEVGAHGSASAVARRALRLLGPADDARSGAGSGALRAQLRAYVDAGD